MISYLLADRLKPVSWLFDERKRALQEMLATTDGGSLKDAKKFDKRLKDIYKAILIDKAELGEGKARILYGSKYSVEYSYKGFRDLLKYRPDTGTIGLESPRFYQPVYDRLSVEFELPAIDKEAAIPYAEKQMDSTYDQVERLNKEVDEWNARTTTTIKDKLTAIRDSK